MSDHTVTGYFDHVAPEWDELRAGYFSDAVREAAIARAYLRPEMVVTDVGSGSGFMAAGLAPLVAQVHVIDRAPAMLEVARRKLAQFANVVFYRADGEQLPLADGAVDVVFANMYLHHCHNPQGAIREMVRILRPGGRLMITDLSVHSYTWLQREMADVWMGFTSDQLRTWLRAADLVNVLVRCTGQDCCATAASANTDAAERSARIGVLLATGSKRIAMRQTVQEHYTIAVQDGCGCAEIASSSSGCCSQGSGEISCCGTDIGLLEEGSVQFITDYSPDELAALPPDVETIAFGCGNPVALANLRPGEVVLDIGSGGGIDAFLAARQVGPHGKVIGVDMTPAMIERATRAAAQAGVDNVEFRHGQAEALPVTDASVDVILSNCVINLCEDKGAVFAEAFRVLKPGGRLEISDMVTAGPLPLALRPDESGWSSCISGALPEQEYLDLVAEAGFEEITARRSSSAGIIGNVPVYSIIVSARKPTTQQL